MIKMKEDSSSQVLILSGGSGASPDPDSFTDTNFFVSGAIGSRGTSTAGTAVFGGDVVISGTLKYNNNASLKEIIRYKGIVCDRCGVEVTEKKVRRDRIGHINLVVPVAHIWYFRSLPNKVTPLNVLPPMSLM